jgi:hypothetical protein
LQEVAGKVDVLNRAWRKAVIVRFPTPTTASMGVEDVGQPPEAITEVTGAV